MDFRRVVALLACIAPLSACILKAEGFTGGSGNPGPDAASDAGTNAAEAGPGPILTGDADAGTDAGGTGDDGLPAHGPNLLSNGDFELFCAGWGTYFAALDTSPLVRNGKGACRVCGQAPDGNNHMFANVDRPVKSGERYYAELWFRAEAGKAATAPSCGLQLKSYAENKDDEAQDRSSSPIPAESYARVATLLSTTHDAEGLNLDLQMFAESNECLIVDDATLVLLK